MIMSRAASPEELTLLVSSTYRSYEYQCFFARNVAEMGETEALRVSAAPGKSLPAGDCVDFGSITDDFARNEGRPLAGGQCRAIRIFAFPFPRVGALTGYVWGLALSLYRRGCCESQNEFLPVYSALCYFWNRLSIRRIVLQSDGIDRSTTASWS